MNKLLRSRTLAVWLIGAVGLFAVFATLIPQESLSSADEIERWRAQYPLLASIVSSAGLHRAFSTPLFIALGGLLTITTAACAWERTSMAGGRMRSLGRLSEAEIVAAKSEQAIELPIEFDRALTLDAAAESLRALGMRARTGPLALRADHRPWAVAGSPLFHWAMAALFLFAGLGQLTRWEGRIGLPLGHTLTDAESTYGMVIGAPWSSARRTGLPIGMTAFDSELRLGGAERGFSGKVMLGDPVSATAVEQWVYPNAPLRRGSTLFHRDGWGVSVVLALETTAGAEAGRRLEYFDFDQLDKSGRVRNIAEIPPEIGLASMEVAVPLDPGEEPGSFVGALPQRPRAEITMRLASGETTGPIVMNPNDILDMPAGGLRLRVVDVVPYLRLLAIDDWTIPFIYAFLTLAVVGAGVALLAPPRTVVAILEEQADGTSVLRVRVKASRVDPAFAGRARRQMEAALAEIATKRDERPQ